VKPEELSRKEIQSVGNYDWKYGMKVKPAMLVNVSYEVKHPTIYQLETCLL
jgi:hypothetical protein